ncbi:hypothetical protein PFISCL1PPCAC_17340, partial [Pristionchus fissidentatus]
SFDGNHSPTMVPRLFLVLLLVAVVAAETEYGEGGRRKGKLEDYPRQYPIDGNETRSLHFDYTYFSETVMYDQLENKADSPSIYINASLTFDILHHGNGDVIAVWMLNECFSNNCGTPPPVWVNFRRGGNNINEVFVDNEDVPADYVPRWNFLYAVAHTIYTPVDAGEGDEQYTKTPYGMCSVAFSRPEDKRFRRQMTKCDLKGSTNTTRVDGLLATRYRQDVHYVQNTKVDADIVIIETVEELGLSSPFNDQFGIIVETRSHMEMTNRTFRVTKRLCELGHDTEKCAVDIGLRKVGDRLYENVDMKRAYETEYQKDQFVQTLTALRGIHVKDDAWTEDHAAAVADLVLIVKKLESPSAAIAAALVDDANYDIRAVLATVLGSLGGADAVKTAREVIYSEEHGLKRFSTHFLFGIAHHTHAQSDKFLKELMYWLRDTPTTSALHWEIANTVATVLYRDCDRSVSARNQCDKGKRPILNKFIEDLTACSDDDCIEKVLEVLINLPSPTTVSFAKTHLCSASQSIQLKAAQLIAKAPQSLYNTELTYALLRVFRNTCPSPSSTTASMTALNAMIKSIPESQTAGTLILRTESIASPADQELWSYLYDAIAVSRQFDVTKDEFWSTLRSFRVFRPNYAQRSLTADSNAFAADIADFAGFRGRLRSSSEFASGILRGSNVQMSAVKGVNNKASEWPLFELQLETSGLESYVDSSHPMSDVTNPKASLRLSLLSHALPAFTVFDGHQAMMSAAMNANGQKIRVFESSIPLRTFSTVYPLLSGLSVSLDAAVVTTVRLFGSSEISLWNRESVSEIFVNTTSSITGSASIIQDGVEKQRLDGKLSLITGIQSKTEAKFASKPYRFCVNMGNDGNVISLSTVRIDHEEASPKVQTSSSSTSLPGQSWTLGEAMRKQCRLLLSEQ